MKRIFAATAALGLALGAHSHQAAATTVTINSVGMAVGSTSQADTATISDSALGFKYNGNPSVDVYVGALGMSGTQSPGNASFSVIAWCVDIFHDINVGGSGYQYSVVSGLDATVNDPNNAGLTMNSTQINDIDALMTFGTQAIQGYLANGHVSNPDSSDLGASIEDVSAAYQIAIWSIEYGTVNTTNGALASTTFDYSGLSADATALATYLENNIPFPAGTANTMVALDTNPQQQGFAYSTTGGNGQLVPEPGSLALLGTALVGFGWLRRRRKTA